MSDSALIIIKIPAGNDANLRLVHRARGSRMYDA